MAEKSVNSSKSRLIFYSLLISSVVSSFLSTALNTALPAIISDLRIDVNTGQWITSGFSLAMGIVMPLTAFLITRFRTKGLYLAGLILFIAGSVLCGISNGFIPMMTGRVLQAASNGILVAMTQVVILSIFPKEKQGSYMGWYGLSVSAAPMVAPTLGGLMVDAFGWRSIFYLVGGIMLLSLVFAFIVFENVLETKEAHFDIISFIISIFAFGGITLGIGFITSKGITSPLTLVSLGLGIAGAVLFTLRQFRSSEPFLNLRILKYKNYTLSVIGSMILYLVMMGGTVLTPLYLQRTVGLSATMSGLATLPGSAMSIIFSPIAGKLYDRVGMRKLFLLGGGLFVIGNAGMIPAAPLPVLIIFYAVRSISITFLMMPFVTWGIAGIREKSATAHGTALLTSLRTIAGAIGTAVFVGVMNSAAQTDRAAASANAGLFGFRIAMIGMTLTAVLMFTAGVFLIKDGKPAEDHGSKERP